MSNHFTIPDSEISELLRTKHALEYFIDGWVDTLKWEVHLLRNGRPEVVIPCSWFESREVESRVNPDFSDFEITNMGGSIRFGQYEVASFIVLCEFDPEARQYILSAIQ